MDFSFSEELWAKNLAEVMEDPDTSVLSLIATLQILIFHFYPYFDFCRSFVLIMINMRKGADFLLQMAIAHLAYLQELQKTLGCQDVVFLFFLLAPIWPPISVNPISFYTAFC
jgi:hypothetical protein